MPSIEVFYPCADLGSGVLAFSPAVCEARDPSLYACDGCLVMEENMSPLVPYVWVAGGVHLALVVAGIFLPAELRFRENLAKVSPIIRQLFLVHSVYISTLLLVFGMLCFFFAPELAGGSRLGTFLSGYLAIFWAARVLIQLLYYDPALKREHPFANLAFLLGFVYLSGVFGIAALGCWK